MKYVKRRLGLNQRRARGIALTIELVLLITAIIIMAIVAYFGMSRMVLSQATSQKSTLIVVRAEAYMLTASSVACSIWVQNTGDTTTSITHVGVSYGTNPSTQTRSLSPPVTVRPGETKVISFAINAPSLQSPVYVFVRTSNGEEVGTATSVAP